MTDPVVSIYEGLSAWGTFAAAIVAAVGLSVSAYQIRLSVRAAELVALQTFQAAMLDHTRRMADLETQQTRASAVVNTLTKDEIEAEKTAISDLRIFEVRTFINTLEYYAHASNKGLLPKNSQKMIEDVISYEVQKYFSSDYRIILQKMMIDPNVYEAIKDYIDRKGIGLNFPFRFPTPS